MNLSWTDLQNPVLWYPDWSIKDACCAQHKGTYYVFFSAFDEARSHVAAVTTSDFKTFSDFVFCFSGESEGYTGMCSPDISQVGDTYYLTFNSWGDQWRHPNQLFYISSPDLIHWSERRPLAANLTRGQRAIDAALAYENGAWYLLHKRGRRHQPFLATAPIIDGPWESLGDTPPQFLMQNGQDNGLTHENFQMLKIDGRWRLLSTDYAPHHPYLYTMRGSGTRPEDWLHWEGGYQLNIPEEDFNTISRDNAAALCTWHDQDGYAYLIYAGANEERAKAFQGTASHRPWPRGWNKLGLARSRDLEHWYPAGQGD